MIREVRQFIVATAAGAGLGAGAAIMRRRRLRAHDAANEVTQLPDAPAGRAVIDPSPDVHVTRPGDRLPEPDVHPRPAAVEGPSQADLEALQASVADLEAARARLRRRAAALRAEMEGQSER